MRRRGTALILEVSDNGIGFKEEFLKKRAFRRAPTRPQEERIWLGGGRSGLREYGAGLIRRIGGTLEVETRRRGSQQGWRLTVSPVKKGKYSMRRIERRKIGTTVRWTIPNGFPATAGAEESATVVIGRSVAEKFAGLENLPGIEKRLLIDQGPETVMKLLETGAEEVRYYGSAEEGHQFQAMTDGLLLVRIHSAGEPGFLGQIEKAFSWAGVPWGMIAAGIEALAAGTEELRQAA